MIPGRLYRRWPWCKPYDNKRRLCFGLPVWNGRCARHVRRAAALGGEI